MLDLDMYGKICSFEVYPANQLGTNYKRVQVLSILDFETAQLYQDIPKVAVQVYPTLPKGTSKDYKKYKYVKIKHPNGVTEVVALEWIKQDTLTILEDVVINVKVKADNIQMTETIRNILVANNIEVLDISIS